MNWTREARYTALNADSRERYEASVRKPPLARGDSATTCSRLPGF